MGRQHSKGKVCFLPMGFPCRYGETVMTESFGIVLGSSLSTVLGTGAYLGKEKFKGFSSAM